ncbi:hypothetical protein UlMin_016834 [Ulmus minor]
MDSEELLSLCASLALEEDEEILSPDLEAGLQAQGERSIDISLVGCVLSTGPVARDAFVHMIKEVWKTKERFDVEAIGSNKFVFHFLSTADRRRVISGGPWCFQNKLLVLEEPTGVGDHSKMSFSNSPFWIQLHNIPVFCMSKTVGSILGNMVGTVQEVECNQDGLCLGTFIRVRAIIDISKPLKRILKVRLGSDKELVTILLRYEHLPELCFHCAPVTAKHRSISCKLSSPSTVFKSNSSLSHLLTQFASLQNPNHFILLLRGKRRKLTLSAQMERVRVRLGYTGLLTWDREGRSGGLCLLWSDTIHVQLLSGSRGHIDVQVTSHDSTCWRFTGLYGNPDTSLRTQFWTLLKRLGDASPMPWLCGGDLNEILFSHEKQGGATRAQYLMNAFRDATNYCDLVDLGFRGPKFTWNRGKNACLVQERLDRMLGNSGWVDLFPNSLAHHLNLRGSDHRPLLVELLRVDESSSFGKIWKRGRFHFEEAWVDEKECGNLINNHWRSSAADTLDGVAYKLRLCATDLESWNLENFRRLKMQVRKAKTAFDRVDKNLSNQNWKEHLRLERNLDALRYKEERYWKQRSKDLWLKCGDKNSKFFHQKASARKAKNSISGLMDQNGEWCEEEEGLVHIIESYFKSLFTSSSPSATNYNQVLDTIEPKITPQLNGQLERDFEAEDVRTAVFQMAPTKSPGADGMSAIFYQKFWPIVGEEITAACLGFVNGGLPLGSINETIITLLPKIKNPTRITEFRPISLCNVLYKIISKMLANRMREVMNSVISQEQSAFIPGRLISDNAIIGFECLHAIKRQKTKKIFLALKLDMAKAYDRVEWGFIYKIMNKLGFSEVWSNKIMACISSVSYSFQFNGQRVGHLIPSRGLRQGDPLSPYLFLLCGEGLSSLLHSYEQAGYLQGLRCGRRGPTISHLFFADDSLLFFEATTSACSALKEALCSYEAASGQAVNLSKSAVCFGPNLPEEDAVDLSACLGVPRVRCHENYLGLPCYTGKNKQGIFSSIKDRVWNKLCGWKSKLLSAGGREILAKSIIQAIPAYSMNLFKIPSTLIKELHRLCAQFWWGGNPEKRRMHWCSWEKLCSHKLDGGMGFRDLRLFNKAILAKQAWRIHTHPTSLAARVLQGFYFHQSSFLQVKARSSSSFVWRSILWGRELYKQGLRHKIGSGRDTFIYHDGWLPRDRVFKSSSPQVLGKFDKVSSLITATGSWDSTLIRASFHCDDPPDGSPNSYLFLIKRLEKFGINFFLYKNTWSINYIT